MDWTSIFQSLDWAKFFGFLFGIAGPGALGGLYLNWRKNKVEIKRLQADTQNIKVETDNKLDEIRTRLIDNLQQERDSFYDRNKECFEELEEAKEHYEVQRARITMLEVLLTDNGIPIPY